MTERAIGTACAPVDGTGADGVMLSILTPLTRDAHASCRRISDISTSSGSATRRRRRSATLWCAAGLRRNAWVAASCDVRVADLSVERRGLRPLGRDEREPADEDEDEQPSDREQEGEPPVDPVDHFAPPVGLKPAVTENVSPADRVPPDGAARARHERHVREPRQAASRSRTSATRTCEDATPVAEKPDAPVVAVVVRRRDSGRERRRATAWTGSADRPGSAAPAKGLRAAAPRRSGSTRRCRPRPFAQPRRPAPCGAARPWRRRRQPPPGRRRATPACR